MWAALQPHSRKAVSLQKLLPQWGPPKPVDPAAYKVKALAILEAADAAVEARQIAEQHRELQQ